MAVVKPEVVIQVDEQGARQTAAELDRVNRELDEIQRSAGRAATETKRLGDAQAQQNRQAKSVVGTLGDLGERLDKDIEQRYGRIFKVTDRVNSVFGQFNTVIALGTLAVTGIAAAIRHFTKDTTPAVKGADLFSKSLKAIGDQARQAAADIDAVNMAAQGLANGRFDFTAGEQVTLQAIAREEKARLKTAEAYNAQLLEIERNMRKGFGIAEGDLVVAQARLDAELAALDALRQQRNAIKANAAARGQATARPQRAVQAPTGPDGIAFDEGALGRLSLMNSYQERQNQLLAEQREQWLALGEVLVGPFADAGQEVLRFFDSFEAVQQQASTSAYDLSLSLAAAAQGFGQTALMAAIYGGSVKDAINQEATMRFVQASLGVLFATAQLGLASFLNPAAVPGAQLAIANYAALAALSAGFAAATGGLGASGGGGGSGAAPSQRFAPPSESDFGRDRDEQRETTVNVNLVAGGRPTRGQATTIAIGWDELQRIAGRSLGGA